MNGSAVPPVTALSTDSDKKREEPLLCLFYLFNNYCSACQLSLSSTGCPITPSCFVQRLPSIRYVTRIVPNLAGKAVADSEKT